MINKIIQGNAKTVLKTLPAESINCCITSPPYWGLRDYGIEPVIWDGDKNCKHDFGEYDSKLLHENRQNLDGGTLDNPKYRKNLHGFGSAKAGFCLKCGAWRGSLGLEPTFELYIKHLCDIFDEVKRVLRKDGTCWVNIGDTYNNNPSNGGQSNLGNAEALEQVGRMKREQSNIPSKSLCDIPYRFSIEMINRGWIKRNTIIWHKPDCMPSSADDRFTVDFEYLFFFTKNNEAIFWTNEKTLECVSKKPLGTKGIEGKDWEWRKCPTCQGEGTIIGKALKEGASPRLMKGIGIVDKNTKAFKICPRCKGLKKVKYSFWTGHDYWFDQQFEEFLSNDYDRNRMAKARTEYGGKWAQNSGGAIKTQKAFVDGYAQGRNKRCIWTIPTQPFPEAHFAVYPEGLIEIPIKAGCPEFICKKCGKARMKIYKDTGDMIGQGGFGGKTAVHTKASPTSSLLTKKVKEKKYTGYTDCGCNAGFESGIVLDPFMGAGTTALVALKQRKRFIGIDIKQEYVDMSYRKIANVQQDIF
jgi:DNA modification methylase